MCAVAQAEAESKDSTSLDSAIFALQKSNQCVGAIAPTAPRPLRGVQSLEKGGATASATIALEAEKRGSPAKRYTLWLPKKWRLFRG